MKQCIASILSQRTKNFDLVILENASTDGTREWVQSLSDPRIILLSSEKLLPIHENWRRALPMPKNEFMTFIGHDDIFDPNYLEIMDALVRRDPDAGLYFAHFRYIDGGGKKIRSCRPIAAHETVTDYMSQLFTNKRDTYGTGYLYRSKNYDLVGGMPAWNGLLFADDALWMSLMKRSWNATAREECFAVRVHKESCGHKANWRTWVEGMRNYHEFLTGLAKEDSTFSDALAKHAPKYFFDWTNGLYMRLMEQANKSGRPIVPGDILALKKILNEIAPEYLPHLGFLPIDTRRRIIKHFALTRWLYKWYRHLRYSENVY